MSWEYRVVREKINNKYWYTIREVYHDGKFTENGQHASGMSWDELEKDYKLQRRAFDKPCLEDRDGKLVEAEE